VSVTIILDRYGHLMPGNEEEAGVNEHVASVVARHGRRGWRLDRADKPIDGVVALAMALDRAEQPAAEPIRLLGWLEIRSGRLVGEPPAQFKRDPARGLT
jgi:hypothetical protein